MAYGLVRNRAGIFVRPDSEAFQAAGAGADWAGAPGMYLILTDAAGKGTWPIAGATFILMHREQQSAERATDVLKFFDWAYRKGGKLAEDLSYVPLPDAVVKLIEASWATQIKANGAPVWTSR
jgi:phosphate transport system substrate-binding protein